MFGLGTGELLLILLIVVIFFGVGKLPELGTGLGEAVRNLKKGLKDSKTIDITPESEKESDQKKPS